MCHGHPWKNEVLSRAVQVWSLRLTGVGLVGYWNRPHWLGFGLVSPREIEWVSTSLELSPTGGKVKCVNPPLYVSLEEGIPSGRILHPWRCSTISNTTHARTWGSLFCQNYLSPDPPGQKSGERDKSSWQGPFLTSAGKCFDSSSERWKGDQSQALNAYKLA